MADINITSIVDKIIKLYNEDLVAIESQDDDVLTQKQLFEYSSFKFIKECVIENVIDNKSMWLVKKELDDCLLLSHVYFLFHCWGITGCLDFEYHHMTHNMTM
jgi:hypothetical protein